MNDGGGRSGMPPAGPALSVVVVAAVRAGIQRTLDVLARERDVEVIPVVPWPVPRVARSVLAVPGAVCAAGIGESAAANAGIAAARGRRVLFLRAGDEPRPHTVAAHAAGEPHIALAGRVVPRPGQPEPVEDGWAGVPAPPGLPRAARFLSVDREALLAHDGLDDRLRDLDVAALDLLCRLGGAGLDVAVRPELVADVPDLSPAARRRAAVEAGRSAHALAVIDERRGGGRGPARARIGRAALAWAEPAVAALGAVAPDHPRVERLALRCAFARGRGLPPLPVRPGDRLGPPAPLPAERPAVAMVVPFSATSADADALLDALGTIARRDRDEIVVVDNAREPVVQPRDGIRVVRADGEWSSYHARNAGWRQTTAPWVLFVDADCRPVPWLLDAYFAPPPSDGTGAVAGDVLDAPGRSLSERYSAAVGVLRQSAFLDQRPRGFAATANLLVRRSALVEIGGFTEGIRSSGDADASHRLRDAGWAIEHRPRAAVVHLHRSSMRGLLRQYRRYVAGVTWLRTRFPDVAPDWPPRGRTLLRRVPAHLLGARFGAALVQVITAWTMWRAGRMRLTADDNVAERPAVSPATGSPREPVGTGTG